MSKEPIFLNPIYQERIWGGTKLKELFSYEIPSDKTGECWGISAHPHGQSIVREGEYAGCTLGELWDKHRVQLFGDIKTDEFPLLVKVIDANMDLSVQVHPNDDDAKKYENENLGKTECWYVVDCDEDAEIIYGHTALTKEELQQRIEKKQWDKLLRKVKIKPGDFIFVPSGTVHAIGRGTVILETQQSSDLTYRIYDFDRKDSNGNFRELHLKKGIDVLTVPHKDTGFKSKITRVKGITITKFVQCEYFSVYKWELNNEYLYTHASHKGEFLLVSVIEGDGEVASQNQVYSFKKGDHFIIPAEMDELFFKGQAVFIVSHP